jgi:cbb3-type cytochrome oxidase subunit 1
MSVRGRSALDAVQSLPVPETFVLWTIVWATVAVLVGVLVAACLLCGE